ncbi:hypothetical protein HNY73_006869 [Argiope bruennichi]|uniref:Uncharacterized protein n=1 Tax=Argiope bruennichi TaxID=94029 RepID=A0A8T0FEP3_ARGBR|nr:hypothetical protein HNY73_006869 [Argiope bruennichi]
MVLAICICRLYIILYPHHDQFIDISGNFHFRVVVRIHRLPFQYSDPEKDESGPRLSFVGSVVVQFELAWVVSDGRKNTSSLFRSQDLDDSNEMTRNGPLKKAATSGRSLKEARFHRSLSPVDVKMHTGSSIFSFCGHPGHCSPLLNASRIASAIPSAVMEFQRIFPHRCFRAGRLSGTFKMPAQSLEIICVLRISIFLKLGTWKTYCPNPFESLPSIIIYKLMAHIQSCSKFDLPKIDDVLLLLTCGKLKRVNFTPFDSEEVQRFFCEVMSTRTDNLLKSLRVHLEKMSTKFLDDEYNKPFIQNPLLRICDKLLLLTPPVQQLLEHDDGNNRFRNFLRNLETLCVKDLDTDLIGSILGLDFPGEVGVAAGGGMWEKERYKHEALLCHIPVPTCEKEEIAEKIMNEVQEKRILEDIRQSMDNTIERRHRITRKRLSYYEKAVGIVSSK